MIGPLHELSVAESGAALRAGTLTARTLVEDALARIERIDPQVRSFVHVTVGRAFDDADRADAELRRGVDRGPLHGIPYALKDIYATAGIRTTCHSRLRVDHVPAEDAHVEARLRHGGAVLLGKLATHEFAIGGPSFDLPFPPARNPWNLEHFTGGSSSGSAAAVAAGLTRVALGSDTSGSIRGPACYCGVVGLKPTYGRVSRRGAFPLSYSMDHCGPLTWTVDDCARVMQVIAGHDPLDPGSADTPPADFVGGATAGAAGDLRGLRLAYPRQMVAGADPSPEVLAALDGAVERLARLGATVEEVSFPPFDLFNACGRVIMIGEAYAIHEDDLRRRPRDYARYTYQRIVLGATLSAADYLQAQRLRRELGDAVEAVLQRCDAVVCAAGLRPASRLESFPPDWPLGVSLQTIPYNVTGHPALAVPTGFSTTGLPLGMQVIGRWFDEPTVLRVGRAQEFASSDCRRRPAVATIDR